MKKIIFAISFFSLSWAALPLSAEVMTYQGRLKESNVPVNANRVFSFKFCDAESFGNCDTTPSGFQSFTVQNGLFKSTFTIPASNLTQGEWYLQVSVGADAPSIQDLSPRERLTAVPYSVYSATAGYSPAALQKAGDTMAGQLTSLSSVTITGNGGVYGLQVSSNVSLAGALYSANGNVGIGTAAPQYPLVVYGSPAGNIINAGDAANPGGATAGFGLDDFNTYPGAALYVNNAKVFNVESNGGAILGSTYMTADAVRNGLIVQGHVGIGTALPNYALEISSGAGEAGTIMSVSTGATNLFWVAGDGAHSLKFTGDGSGLTGITGAVGTDSSKVLKAGDTMTGSLLMDAGSTVTITGSAFSVGGSTLVAVDGKVGIGTALPDTALHIAYPNSNGPGLKISNSAAAVEMGLYGGIGNQFFIDRGGNRFVINSSGHVGIGGVYSPGAALDVKTLSSGGPAIGLRVSSGTTAEHSPLFQVQQDGNVGIGTANPGAMLEVAGSGSFTGSITSYSSGTFKAAGGNQFSVETGSGILVQAGRIQAPAIQLTNGAAANYVLTSDTAGNAKWMDPAGGVLGDGWVGNEITDAANASLTRSGTGLAADPYKLALNLSNANNWIAAQTFNAGLTGSLSGAASQNILKAGDTMTGQLTLAGSTLTVAGNAFSVGGSTLVVANGYLGLGTNAPAARLHVVSDDGYVNFASPNTPLIMNMIPQTYAAAILNNNGDGAIVFAIANDEQMRIDRQTLIGIGTQTPAYRLHVSSGAGEAGTIMAVSTGATNIFSVDGYGVNALKFTGDGSGLTGVSGSDATKLPLAGGTMIGDLFMSGGSSISVTGAIGISTAVPGAQLAIEYEWPAATPIMTVWEPGAGYTFGLDKSAQLYYGPFLNYGSGSIVNFGGNQTQVGSNAVMFHLYPQSVDPGGYLLKAQDGADMRLAIDSEGRVGAGTALPASRFEVAGGSITISGAEAALLFDGDARKIAPTTDASLGGGLYVSTNVYVVGFSSAAKYYGDGSALTGVSGSDVTKLPLGGGFMSGQLTNTSSVTITGNGGAYGLAVSSNVSLAGALYSANGNVGIGVTAPGTRLEVEASGPVNTALFKNSSANQNGITLQSLAGTDQANNIGFESYSSGQSGLRSKGAIMMKTGGNLVFVTSNDGNSIGFERMRIAALGNVGISTGAPQARLDVLAGGSAATDMAQIWRNSAGTIVSSVSATGVSMAAKFVGDGSALTGVSGTDDTKLPLGGGTLTGQLTVSGSTLTVISAGSPVNSGVLWASTSTVTPALFVSTTGRVGIGTASPDYPLHIIERSGQVGIRLEGYDTSIDSIYIDSKNSGKPTYGYVRGGLLRAYTQVDTANRFNINVNSLERLTVTPLGFVGINDVSPAYLLHVSSPAGEAGTIMAVSTGATNLFWVAGDGAHATSFYGDGSGLTGISGNDATKLPLAGGTMAGDITMGANNLYAVSTITATGDITAARYQIAGSTVLAILPGVGSLGVGVGAGRVNTGNNNLFLGYSAGYFNTTGGNNSFLGFNAGLSNNTGGNNSFLGFNAGYSNTAGADNSFLGAWAGNSNTTGIGNSFLGSNAGPANTTGDNNSFLGFTAGYSNTTGSNNSFFGSVAGNSNTTGGNNSFFGSYAGRYTKAGSANAVFGIRAGQGVANNSFSSATIMGYQAGYGLTTGNDNILLGFQAGYNVTSGTGNIVIGYGKDTSAAAANNELNIGGVLYGDLSAKTIGISRKVPEAALDIVSTGTVQTQFAQIWRDSNGNIQSSMSATGVMMASKFVGNGSGITGVSATDVTKLPLAGGTMVGQLTLAGSTLTVTGGSGGYGLTVSSNVSLGGAIYTANGYVGIGTASPINPLTIAGTFLAQVPTGGVSGVIKTLDQNFGTDLRLVSGVNAWAMSIGSLAEYHAYALQYYNGSGWSTALNMTKTGNLGLGTGTGISSYRLQVSSAAGETGILMAVSTGATNVFWAAGDGAHATTFWGNGSGLTGVSGTDATKLPLTGGSLSGQLFVLADTGVKADDIVTNGISISTGGAIQTTGLGHGTVSGNARGKGAVDLQVSRLAATQIAGGDGSVLSGGDANSATGLYAVVSGGQVNVAGATYASVAGGGANKATGYASAVHGGQGNLASASGASVSGNSNTGSGSYSTVSGGSLNTALGQYSWAAGYRSSSTANGAFTRSDSEGIEVRNATDDRTVFKNRGGFMITAQTGVLPGNEAMLEVRSTGAAAGFYAQIWRDSTGLVVASMTATGRLSGDGSGLTGVSANDATKLPLTGGRLSGWLEAGSNSTITITGNAFSVGGSTLVVEAGRVGIGAAAPLAALDVRGKDATSANYALFAGDNIGNQYLSVRNDGSIGLGTPPTGNRVTVGGNVYYNTAGAAIAMDSSGGGVNYGHIGVIAPGAWGFSSGNSGITMNAPALSWTEAGRVGIGTGNPGSVLEVVGGSVTIHGSAVHASVFQAGDNGIIISTGGAIQTTGVGHGTIAGNARGNGAVDLQTNRGLGTQVASGKFSFIGGGQSNTASGSQSTVGGGDSNTASSQYAAVGGGYNNTATLNAAVVAGGSGNDAMGLVSSILGGVNNLVSASWSTVGGGAYNVVSGSNSIVGGGVYNVAAGTSSVIAGGDNNRTENFFSSVGGGKSNTARELYATVGGGFGNYAGSMAATIGGGSTNNVNNSLATIGGGQFHTIDAAYGTVAGGLNNKIQSFATAGFIGGGENNISTGAYSTIGGGRVNSSSGAYSAVLGGYGNAAEGAYSAVAGGNTNRAYGANSAVSGGKLNTAWGDYSIVAGGDNNSTNGADSIVAGGNFNLASNTLSAVVGGNYNTAAGMASFIGGGGNNQTGLTAWGAAVFGANNAAMGQYSFAAGYKSTSAYDGSFTWADSQGIDVVNNVPDQVRFKARGGFLVSGSTNTADAGFFVSGDGSVTMGKGLFISNRGAVQTTGIGTGSVSPNVRDATAVDLQNNRENAAQVASGYLSVISGGGSNTAGNRAAVGGGQYNTASGQGSAVAGGYSNTAAGAYSVVPGGVYNSASSDYSFAAGRRAQSAGMGAFTWADSRDVPLFNNVQDRAWFKASGGFLVTASTQPDVDGKFQAGMMGSSFTVQVNGDLALGDGDSLGNKPVTIWLINRTGGTRSYGDIVALDLNNDNSFLCAGVASTTTVVGVVYDQTIALGATGRVAIHGVVDVKTYTTVTRGNSVVTNGVGNCMANSANPSTIVQGAGLGKWLQAGGGAGALRKAVLLSH